MIPIFVNLEGYKALVFGFGNVGKRRVKKLLKSGASITVYSKDVIDIEKEYEKVEFINCDVNSLSYKELYNIIKNYDIIVTAIDKANNERIVKIARDLRKLVNSSTFEDDINLIIPAYCEIDDVSFAIYTKGKSPLIAREVRKLVENYLTHHEDQLILQSSVRDFLKNINSISDQRVRKEILEKIFDNERFREELLKLIERYR
ncbi:MAG: precorrin-2 dehydrogenase [Methanothermococcus sp.]|jgi:precorrin-2 dehydrogenase/sirohydrochlorin ferrochelatase|uniref:precorrin-2 dehydrogenase/sirohydrochlorin ferrochelatase family protein n=1 Tax=Methanothermococcus TaxID=155862 RepID=UPI000376DCAF|nr:MULTISPECIES: bifunctional precorrin-2 dehydrogenase/sirohydrochlorin ferrochelatase [Methanothermococcus]MDK2790786.1 precorrin-2 dehydrogenase [Methanothermococcus sp.]MDK2988139.1 precorrin-2 dehydrogenase [Methanothermococcus sp.]